VLNSPSQTAPHGTDATHDSPVSDPQLVVCWCRSIAAVPSMDVSVEIAMR
jgi:hypothetical protein